MSTPLNNGRAGVLALVAGALCLTLATAPANGQCVGDCNGSGTVQINELVIGVNIALGTAQLSACPSFACTGGDTVPINCLVQGVNNALGSCPTGPTNTPTLPTGETPTATPSGEISPTETPTSPVGDTPTATPTQTTGAGPVCNLKSGTCMGGSNAGANCTANGQCPGGTCNTQGDISKIELNIAALPIPLSFAVSGSVSLAAGAPDQDGKGKMDCDIVAFDPINIPQIGFVCITPSQNPCPDGTVDCDGGTPLSIDLLSDGNIGQCASQAACDTACDTYCAGIGSTRQLAGCVGFCSGGTMPACTADAQCLPDNGACNGPDPVGANANICQCQCVNTMKGETGAAGDFQCQLGSKLVVESAAPCDGTDITINVGDSCIPITTANAGSLITHANFDSGCTTPPCMVPASGPILNTGLPLTCSAYGSGPLTGLKTVGVVSFFGSALGDLATEIFTVCQ